MAVSIGEIRSIWVALALCYRRLVRWGRDFFEGVVCGVECVLNSELERILIESAFFLLR